MHSRSTARCDVVHTWIAETSSRHNLAMPLALIDVRCFSSGALNRPLLRSYGSSVDSLFHRGGLESLRSDFLKVMPRAAVNTQHCCLVWTCCQARRFRAAHAGKTLLGHVATRLQTRNPCVTNLWARYRRCASTAFSGLRAGSVAFRELLVFWRMCACIIMLVKPSCC